MSGHAHHARRDASEVEVIDALEVCGYAIWKLAQRRRPDLLVLSQARTLLLVEVKTGKAKHRDTQDWAAQGWPVVTLRTAEQVFAWHYGRARGETGEVKGRSSADV